MLNEKTKSIIFTAVFVLLIAGAVIIYNLTASRTAVPNFFDADKAADSAEEKTPAPDFSMIDINGNEIMLSGMKGKPVVLNFWASWCPPCRVEMPDFDKVYKELGDDVHFMMVCLVDGVRETIQRGTVFITEQGFSFPVYFDTRQEGAYAYGIRSIPTTLFIDSEGFAAAGVQGAIDESTLRRGISLIR